MKWTLSATDWATLSDPAAVNGKTPASLSIAATSTLRAALWKVDLPILPAPDWATSSKPVFSSSTLPVEVRESLAALSTTISALNAGDSKTTVSYDVPNLGLLGTSGGNAEVETMLAATFQAQPFAEPFTRKFYVRERWYDPATGTWLTPDPSGYRDSANLYSFCGGDPVNRRDSKGMDRSELADDRKALATKRQGERQGERRAADQLATAEHMKAQAELKAFANALFAYLREQGLEITATDIIYRFKDGVHALTASGNVIYDRDGSGAIGDVTEDLVVLVVTLQTASPAIALAWRTGGPIAAAAVVVDEVIGNFAGVNPSVMFKASFKIAGTMILTAERAEAFLVERGLSRLQARDFVASFDGPIALRSAHTGEKYFRYATEAGTSGRFYTRAEFSSANDAANGLYLKPYGNTGEVRQVVTVTHETFVLDGQVRNGRAATRQVFAVDPGAFSISAGAKF